MDNYWLLDNANANQKAVASWPFGFFNIACDNQYVYMDGNNPILRRYSD